MHGFFCHSRSPNIMFESCSVVSCTTAFSYVWRIESSRHCSLSYRTVSDSLSCRTHFVVTMDGLDEGYNVEREGEEREGEEEEEQKEERGSSQKTQGAVEGVYM